MNRWPSLSRLNRLTRLLRLKQSDWWRNGIPILLVTVPLGLWRDSGWEVVAGQRLNLNAVPWQTQFESTPAATPATDAESLLRESHRLLNNGQRAEALSVAQEMVVRYPRFQLGQLLFADLLALTTEPPMDARLAPPVGSSTSARLQQLNDEARLRLNRPDVAAYAGKEPAGLAYVSPKVPYLVVVDASRSRLYVLSNTAGAGQTEPRKGLQVVFESYISVGQNGVGKQVRGDGKTPIGAYTIQKSMPGYALPDLYGSGALTLNYPNDLDTLHGKTGSGIWIHGSPSEQYARAPEATDGCVVLANPDMLALMQMQFPAGTPVFIQRQIDWVAPHKNRSLEQTLRASLRAASAAGAGSGEEEVLALMSWQDAGQRMAATLSSNAGSASARTAQIMPSYWVEESRQWVSATSKLGEWTVADRSTTKTRGHSPSRGTDSRLP